MTDKPMTTDFWVMTPWERDHDGKYAVKYHGDGTSMSGDLRLRVLGGPENLEKLLETTRADERERCADACAVEAERHRLNDDLQRMDAARWCERKIRALGEKGVGK